MKRRLIFYVIIPALVVYSCQSSETAQQLKEDSLAHCASNLPSRFATDSSQVKITAPDSSSKKGMVWIPGGKFLMGASDDQARQDEYPQHNVQVPGFWMDATEVTNLQFAEFVKATGYITTAERKPDWEELKKQVPPGTPKPADSLLVAASLVFTPPSSPVPLTDASIWWRWVTGASWKHPEGPSSTVEGKGNYPVVQVSWDDAMAYAKWAGKRLPTEAEWEFAARAGFSNQPYTWGSEGVDNGKQKANIWQGRFPDINKAEDGYKGAAPVKSFESNRYGLYDMAGNVWEWCSDWYRADYYQQFSPNVLTMAPKGPESSYDPEEPLIPKRTVRGGSFLCHASYCASYRVSARMKTSPDTGLEHTGFRCVAN